VRYPVILTSRPCGGLMVRRSNRCFGSLLLVFPPSSQNFHRPLALCSGPRPLCQRPKLMSPVCAPRYHSGFQLLTVTPNIFSAPPFASTAFAYPISFPPASCLAAASPPTLPCFAAIQALSSNLFVPPALCLAAASPPLTLACFLAVIHIVLSPLLVPTCLISRHRVSRSHTALLPRRFPSQLPLAVTWQLVRSPTSLPIPPYPTPKQPTAEVLVTTRARAEAEAAAAAETVPAAVRPPIDSTIKPERPPADSDTVPAAAPASAPSKSAPSPRSPLTCGDDLECIHGFIGNSARLSNMPPSERERFIKRARRFFVQGGRLWRRQVQGRHQLVLNPDCHRRHQIVLSLLLIPTCLVSRHRVPPSHTALLLPSSSPLSILFCPPCSSWSVSCWLSPIQVDTDCAHTTCANPLPPDVLQTSGRWSVTPSARCHQVLLPAGNASPALRLYGAI
jgi:hypothetical protein